MGPDKELERALLRVVGVEPKGERRKRRLPGRELLLPEPEPWPDPVDGETALSGVEGILRRRVVMGEHEYVAVTLWIALTYLFGEVETLPILAITSPLKRCGKTHLLEELSKLCWRPLPASNITPAAAFRVIERAHPTLLIDEADSFLPENEELRGVLNSGTRRGLAFVVRCVGDAHEERVFSTWCPKAVALIGELPATLHDRAVVVRLQRKPPGTYLDPVPSEEYQEATRKLRRWIREVRELVQETLASLPPLPLDDRSQDNWASLRAIAMLAGGDWPRRADEAALALSGDEDEGGEARIMLLADLRALFEETGEERLPTAEILDYLHGLEERPWAEWRHGRPITARSLARLLEPFGIYPRVVRVADKTFRGYLRESLEDAFSRYLSSIPPSLSVTSVTSQVNPQIQNVTSKASVTDRKRPLNWDVTLVTHRKGGGREKRVSEPQNPQLPLETSGDNVQVLAEKPHRIELRPACHTLVVQAAGGILPWQYVFADRVLARLPLGLLEEWRLAFVSGDRCWTLPWGEADPETRPSGSLFSEGQWRELAPQGGASFMRTHPEPLEDSCTERMRDG